MLSKILNKKTCAECRICCIFDKEDKWEAPILSNQNIIKSLEIVPKTCFLEKGNNTLYAMDLNADGYLQCPMLSNDGCMLKDEKPFDCRIWPFRIMNLNGTKVITVSPVCPSIYSEKLSTLQDFLNTGLAQTIFDKANQSPEIIKDYIKGYPILLTE